MKEKMPILTPRQIRTAEVKNKIVKAATSLIAENGIASVTVANICKKAEVSVGSFYHHFENKDQVLTYYLTDAFHSNAEAFDRITGDDIVQNILICYRLYNQFLVDQGYDFVSNYYTTGNHQLYSKNRPDNSSTNAPIMGKIHSLCEDAVRNGYISPDCDLDLFYFDLTVIEKGIIFDWCNTGGSYDLISEASRIMENYMKRTVVTSKYQEEFNTSPA